MDEEAERGAGDAAREHARGVLVQVEGDDREADGGDRADAGGEAVDAVGEVHDVHHRDEAEQRQRAAEVAEVDAPEEREREVVDADAREDADQARRRLPEQLDAGREVADVVGDADGGDQRRRAEDAAHLRLAGRNSAPATSTPTRIARPPSSGVLRLGQPALLDRVDRADPHREPRDERRDGRRQRQGDQKGKQRAFFHG